MTDRERRIWRDAFVLYDNNHEMPDTEDSWLHYIEKIAEFAGRYDWRNDPLAASLALAVLDAVERECGSRIPAPVQVSLFCGEDPGPDPPAGVRRI